MHVVTDYTLGTVVRELTMTPAVDRLDALIGKRAGGGFRKVLDLETGAERGSLPYLLLDDVPGATLVSGVAMTTAADRGDAELEEFRVRMRSQPRLQVADLCAGWQAGGTLLTNLVDGRPPMLLGPVAPPVLDRRRSRRLAHARAVAGRLDTPSPPASTCGATTLVHVDVFFRDSVMSPEGDETVVHEYTVDATVDPETMTVVACSAVPRVLPWRECPQAIGSAGRIVGVRVVDLRPEVRTRARRPDHVHPPQRRPPRPRGRRLAQPARSHVGDGRAGGFVAGLDQRALERGSAEMPRPILLIT